MKGYSLVVASTLFALIALEAVILKLDLLSKNPERRGSSRYDKNVREALECLRRVAVSSGYEFAPSSTVREVAHDLSGKLPEEDENLAGLRRSLEGYLYGGVKIGDDDLIYYPRWIRFARTYLKGR